MGGIGVVEPLLGGFCMAGVGDEVGLKGGLGPFLCLMCTYTPHTKSPFHTACAKQLAEVPAQCSAVWECCNVGKAVCKAPVSCSSVGIFLPHNEDRLHLLTEAASGD